MASTTPITGPLSLRSASVSSQQSSRSPGEIVNHNTQFKLTRLPLRPVHRIMASGRCSALVVLGKFSAPCPCPRGSFGGSFDTLEVKCHMCAHPLLFHDDATPAINESSLPHSEQIPDSLALNFKLEVDPDPPATRCLRNETVTALWDRLQEVPVVHVRGTPASGKSTLASLLSRHVKKTEPGLKIFKTTWPSLTEIPSKIGRQMSFHVILNWIFGLQIDADDWTEIRALLIMDEAQDSYEYMSLWNDLIKGLDASSYLKIALFSSYGSPGSRALECKTPTPIIFNPDQRVSIRHSPVNPNLALFFTRPEFDDVVTRFGRWASEHGQAFVLSQELQDYVWEFTCGHPAGVWTILDGLRCSEKLRPFLKTSTEIPLSDALELLTDDNVLIPLILNAKTGFRRGIPERKDLQESPDLAKFLRGVLAFNRSEGKWQSNPSLNTCYRSGWLQAELIRDEETIEETIYVFPSMIHRRYVEYLLSAEAPPFPVLRFPCIRDLCFAACREFKPAALRTRDKGLSTGARPRPVEAQYQNELYRACYALLDSNIYLTSEWSGKGTSGRVDFHIKSVGWAIECVREGDRIQDHIDRFEYGGQYYKWVISGAIKDYVILDFRTSRPRKPRVNDHLYSIVFYDEFTSYEILDARLKLVQEKITLLA